MDSIRDLVQKLRADDPELPLLGPDDSVSYRKFLEFTVMQWNGAGKPVPTEALPLPGKPSDGSYMYRGQNQRYPVCMPSLLRKPIESEWDLKSRLALERFQVAELELILAKHPFSEIAKKFGYKTDFHALAQHYGIPTSLLDVTSNIEIAAFFATAKWNEETETFSPMDSGQGVMYRLEWTQLGPGFTKHFEPVGFGPGLRPARQHAWTFKIPPGRDFEDVPHLTAFEFEHSKIASADLFEQFQDGEVLYPPDCLAPLVKKLRALPFISMHAIRYAAEQDGVPLDELDQAADRSAKMLNQLLGMDVLEGHRLELEQEDIDIAASQARTLDAAFRDLRVAFRLTSTRPDPQ